MSDYTKTKNFGNFAYPVNAKDVPNLIRRVEPILTPEQLISRYLKGIDIEDWSTDELKDRIELAINDMEILTGLNFTKIQFNERQPFDQTLYKSFVHFRTDHGPILSVESVAIVSSNGDKIFEIPDTWIEAGRFFQRQVNLIPILSIFGATQVADGQTTNAGLVFLKAIQNFNWLPAFFTLKYTAGVSQDENKLPIVINQIIGQTAAIDILSQKQAQYRYTSQSIGQDGISQASSGPGPQVYVKRIEDLTNERERLLQKIKQTFSKKIYVDNI